MHPELLTSTHQHQVGIFASVHELGKMNGVIDRQTVALNFQGKLGNRSTPERWHEALGGCMTS